MPEPLARAGSSRHVSEHIAEKLREDIAAGRLKPGDRLPSIAKLAEQHNVAKGTVQRAIDALSTDGILEKWQGRGVYVIDKVDATAAVSPTIGELVALVTQLQHRLDDVERRITSLQAKEGQTPRDPRPTPPVDE